MSASDARLRLRGGLPAMLALTTLTLALAACGGGQENAAADAASPAGTAATPPADGPASSATPAGAAPAPAGDAPAPAARFGERQLDHPDDLQMLMLAYRLEGRVPPVADWAAAQSRVAYADEFQRPALLKEEQGRLQGIYDGTAEVGLLRMNVNARFGEYDAGRGGYYLDAFMPGSAFHFDVQPAPHPVGRERITLQVDNTDELNFWPLDAAAAKDVLQRNSGLRNVTLDSRFRITGVSRRSDGPVISVRLLGYAIGSDHYGRPATFGERRFDSAAQGGQ